MLFDLIHKSVFEVNAVVHKISIGRLHVLQLVPVFSLFSLVSSGNNIVVIYSQVAEDLPKNLEESVSKFATKSPKVSCFSVVDSHGKTNVTLTYGKSLSLSHITFSSIHIPHLLFLPITNCSETCFK